MVEEQRKHVGLALGGGVARGIAHLGVISVLEEAGIPIDCISGTSVGAIIAAGYAAGIGAQRLIEYAHWFRWRRIARPVLPLKGLVSFDRLASWMVREFGDLTFADLKIPCAVVATDLRKGEPVALRQGRLAPAVQGSCSVPGFVTPVELDGRLLCDGGVSDMLPASVLRSMGADLVIGVDIFAFKIRPSLGPVGYLLAGLEILLDRSGCGVDEADCLIAPDLAGKPYTRFSQRVELIELGRQAALQKLPCIQSALGGDRYLQ
ncbi:MAG: patatin-like phospholipase family protein [Anaerolineales bacterium]|nr:patatin-like phospholipase family protein [Anaerolineales bacterium]